MAAGGYKEFVAGEILDEDEINDFLMQGVLVFAGTAARGSAITSPVEGQFAFLKDSDALTFYNGTAWAALESGLKTADFLVIAGGGGGGRGRALANREAAGGGGAGGYLCSVAGENSGGDGSAVPPIGIESGSAFTVTVGAGGAASSGAGIPGTIGNLSRIGGV